MKLKVLLFNWNIEFNSERTHQCELMLREIYFNKFESNNEDYIKRIISHELTHALLSELGQSQNQLMNGRIEDSFDCEFICEFMAIYSSYLIELTNKVYKEYLSIK